MQIARVAGLEVAPVAFAEDAVPDPAPSTGASPTPPVVHWRAAGAHHVARSVADCLPIFDEIDARLERGERP